MNEPRTIQLLRTEPHDCSYLKGAIATTEFVSPEENIGIQTYQAINDAGFRRSGAHFYRPSCGSCTECKALRVQVESFAPTKSQKRILRKNSDLEIRITSSPDADGYFELYQEYIQERHQDGDMYPPDREQFDNFICTPKDWTRFIEFYTDELVMVAVCDFLPRGLSAIYSFFDPKHSGKSLGSYAILAQIDIANKLELPFLYLGYWIEESEKMNYKNRYNPCEILENKDWRSLPF
ncbi:MAG: arginyltransferase [Porticoccaceae bacterium]|nr:arginyltransferase [Porticoccaceae bacterium]